MSVTTDRSGGGVAIDVAGLTKTYRGSRGAPAVRALDGLDLRVGAGTVLGLLGPNGAGKSTTVRVLATLTRPDSGTAVVAGHDVSREPAAVRRAIGYVAQRPVTDPMGTGRENLVLAARLQGLGARAAAARADELLERFGVADAAHRLVRTWSGGMARKLDVAMGLVHRPQVLFLDEPTTGLDPDSRAALWAEIARLASVERMTVLLTTHYLDEADRLADRVVIVDRGRSVVTGTPDELKDALHGDGLTVEVADEAALARAVEAARRVPGVVEVRPDGRVLRARAASGAGTLPALLAALDAAAVEVRTAGLSRPSLDDVYLRHTGRSLDAAESDAARAAGVAA
ncbi:ABC transporter ATP-binding protein [Cellulomonas massiliensis]|uniref:ABC transporter ATP-binding protein n=1 Tax=Cellulomonas massiliensis TaxID=1465811 RepID=UPI0002F59A12|nr:ATP-binding cassette domain-containing protein [Cellulomonas massiliensis]